MEQKFPNAKSELERYNLLRGTADKVHEMNISRPLSNPEKVSISDDIGEISKVITEIDDEIKQYKKTRKEQYKLMHENLKKLRSNEVCELKECFDFRDHANGMVNTYDKEGILVKSRRMNPEERQATIFGQELKEGTND